MKYCFAILIHLFLIESGLQGQATFTASANANRMIQNSTVTVSFTISNGEGRSFDPPSFTGFEVISGPATRTSMKIVNGRSSSEYSYVYTLMATKAGKFRINPASVIVKGKKLTTKPLIIEVVKGKSSESLAESDKKMFVQIEVSDSAAVIGQQIRLDYVVYTQQNINGYDITNESDYDGFFSQNTRSPRSGVNRKVIDGEEYFVKGIKSVILFPQRTGAFEIDPVNIVLAIPIPGQRTRRGFFSSTPTRKVIKKTNKQKIIVTDLPQPTPDNFSGAVGSYRMAASIANRRISTDDAILLTMEIRGNGDGKTISAPKQKSQPNLEYYDPNILKDENFNDVGFIDNYKQIEYLIVPKKPGKYSIKPEFTYYDTDSNAYRVLTAGPYDVRVSQGSRKVTTDDRDVSVTGQMFPEKTTSITISPSMLRYDDGWLYGGFGLCLLGLLGIFYKKRQMDIEAGIDPVEKKRKLALSVAIKQLEQAKSFLEAGDGRSFFGEVSTAMNGFLGDKYQIPNTDLDKHKIISHLKENGVDQAYIARYMDILKQCELAIFAGQSQQGMKDVYDKSIGLIQDLV